VFIIDHEILIRPLIFFGTFLFMSFWEGIAPRRKLQTSKATRWFANLSLAVVNGVAGRFFFSLSATGLAVLSDESGWGLFHRLHLPPVVSGLFSLLLLDFAIYFQHLLFHKIRILWSIHGMHHTDLDIDVTTGARFHPLEILLSLLIKMSVIVAFGIPPWAFIVFEILLNGTSMFNHSNIILGARTDRILRYLLVTPDMHRVHHSVIIRERNSNFGFNVPWWDRLFGTYRSQPEAGHQAMMIGLANFRDGQRLSLPHLMLFPFQSWAKL
jgi:sterol desaturase/sphingolipid hydroxylase (fatty acid hydroxylase superfamily)